MSMWRLFYHLVWATKNREALLDAKVVDLAIRSMQADCIELGGMLHESGFRPDHMHLVVSIPPRIAVSEFVHRLKGKSSRRINETLYAGRDESFGWQSEYGVCSFSERSLPDVIAYVQNQRQRHSDNRLWPMYETDDPRVAEKLLAQA
jgi:putative transposase